jgi:hypothetical protein
MVDKYQFKSSINKIKDMKMISNIEIGMKLTNFYNFGE